MLLDLSSFLDKSFLETCLLACSKIFQTSVPWQHLNLLSGSKEHLQDVSLLQVLLTKEAFWNNAPNKTQFVCTGLCQHYESHIHHHIFVEEALSGSLSCLQLQWDQGAAPCPAPACGWSHSAATVVETLVIHCGHSRGRWGDLDEGFWLLGCLQIEQMAGCWIWVLHNPINCLFWHKQF